MKTIKNVMMGLTLVVSFMGCGASMDESVPTEQALDRQLHTDLTLNALEGTEQVAAIDASSADTTVAEKKGSKTDAKVEPVVEASEGLLDNQVQWLGPPPATTLTIAASGVKTLKFSWNAVGVGSSIYYKLYESPDGTSAFTQMGANLTTTQYLKEVAVHFQNWQSALYRVDACNSQGCTPSATVSSFNAMIPVIGSVLGANTEIADWFGVSIALSADGQTMAVGAELERSNATGINGNGANNSAPNSGAAYVFKRSGTGWVQQAYIKASDSISEGYFGCSVTLSADGNMLFVGACGEIREKVYLYSRSGSTWTALGYFSDPDGAEHSGFGGAVVLSGDGNTLAVGSPIESTSTYMREGAVHIYKRVGTVWHHDAKIKPQSGGDWDYFGRSLALSYDGNRLAVGADGEDSSATGVGGSQTNNSAADSGAAYVYRGSPILFVNGVWYYLWQQEGYIKASNTNAGDRFGSRVSLSNDGNTLAVGAPFEDSSATGIGGSQSSNSAADSGAAYVFTFTTVWVQQAYIKASNTGAGDHFGDALDLSGDGNTLAVGAPLEDSNAIGINGNQADNSAAESGAAYAFTRPGIAYPNWSQKSYIKRPTSMAGARFCKTVALNDDGKTLASGTTFQSLDPTVFTY